MQKLLELFNKKEVEYKIDTKDNGIYLVWANGNAHISKSENLFYVSEEYMTFFDDQTGHEEWESQQTVFKTVQEVYNFFFPATEYIDNNTEIPAIPF